MSEPSSPTTPGRIALVTGVNRGVGLAIVSGLAQLGLQVLLSARHLHDTRAAVDRLAHSEAGALTPVQLDVPDAASVMAAAPGGRSIRSSDVLINNAATQYDEDDVPSRVDLGVARVALEVNVLRPWRVCQAFLPLLRRSRAGRIVNVSGGTGSLTERPDASAPAYSVSKAARVRCVPSDLDDLHRCMNSKEH